jgi:hypothetical protein
MRKFVLLAATAMLSACGGAGVEAVSSTAPVGGTTTQGTFVNPTESKTYAGIGGVQHYEYSTRSDSNGQGGQLYAGDADTVRDSGISVTYDPRDAIFDISINRPKGDVSVTDNRFQDPEHRTAFGGLAEPQAGVPQLSAAKNIQYLQSGTSSGNLLSPADPKYDPNSDYLQGDANYSSSTTTFFYQKPGTTTQYVTYAGYVSNSLSVAEETDTGAATSHLKNSYALDRGVFVYGEETSNNAVPISGTGTYTGDMIATMVFNPRPDTDPAAATYYQWIDGSQTTKVDFGTLKVASNFTGTVLAPTLDAHSNDIFDMPAGSIFTANAVATIDLVNKGGFSGSFTDAKFTRPGLSDFVVSIAGSSLDAAFFGPKAEEIGGGFRIVGGTPDQRIDILGAFTGKK